MEHYKNYTIGPIVYFGLHTGYCVCWLFKEAIYPDPAFNAEMNILEFVSAYCVLGVYWIAPYVLISSRIVPHLVTLLTAVPICLVGFFFHFGADSQKYFILKTKKGLITDGFFSRTRNPNFLGEVLIYSGWSILAESITPLAVLLLMITVLFYPRMLKKEKSLSRYPEFQEYKLRTNFIVPRLF